MSAMTSRKLVIGKPLFSSSSLSFLSATTSPVRFSRARKTTPYEPSSMWFSRSYSLTERHDINGG
jgi:hypothetical protein